MVGRSSTRIRGHYTETIRDKKVTIMTSLSDHIITNPKSQPMFLCIRRSTRLFPPRLKTKIKAVPIIQNNIQKLIIADNRFESEDHKSSAYTDMLHWVDLTFNQMNYPKCTIHQNV